MQGGVQTSRNLEQATFSYSDGVVPLHKYIVFVNSSLESACTLEVITEIGDRSLYIPAMPTPPQIAR